MEAGRGRGKSPTAVSPTPFPMKGERAGGQFSRSVQDRLGGFVTTDFEEDTGVADTLGEYSMLAFC